MARREGGREEEVEDRRVCALRFALPSPKIGLRQPLRARRSRGVGAPLNLHHPERVRLNDGGKDLRVKMELHPKSVLWQVRLGVNVFSAERVAAAQLEVQKKFRVPGTATVPRAARSCSIMLCYVMLSPGLSGPRKVPVRETGQKSLRAKKVNNHVLRLPSPASRLPALPSHPRPSNRPGSLRTPPPLGLSLGRQRAGVLPPRPSRGASLHVDDGLTPRR